MITKRDGPIRVFGTSTVLPESDLADEDKVRAAVVKSGVEAIIVMRPMYDEQETRYVPGSYPTYYNSFYGYYGWAYPVVYSPGYFKQDRLVGIETNIYDTADGKLVWSGMSETTNPKNTRKTMSTWCGTLFFKMQIAILK